MKSSIEEHHFLAEIEPLSHRNLLTASHAVGLILPAVVDARSAKISDEEASDNDATLAASSVDSAAGSQVEMTEQDDDASESIKSNTAAYSRPLVQAIDASSSSTPASTNKRVFGESETANSTVGVSTSKITTTASQANSQTDDQKDVESQSRGVGQAITPTGPAEANAKVVDPSPKSTGVATPKTDGGSPAVIASLIPDASTKTTEKTANESVTREPVTDQAVDASRGNADDSDQPLDQEKSLVASEEPGENIESQISGVLKAMMHEGPAGATISPILEELLSDVRTGVLQISKFQFHFSNALALGKAEGFCDGWYLYATAAWLSPFLWAAVGKERRKRSRGLASNESLGAESVDALFANLLIER